MKQIALTQGKYALVDDEDFERLNQVKWYVMKGLRTIYAYRKSPMIKGKQSTIYMHHEIAGKPQKGFVNDHIDGDGRNNQRNNLRHITWRQNCQNIKNVQNTSKHPGVHWNMASKSWKARIQVGDNEKHLGYFTDELEAFNAYRQAVEDIGEEVLF